MGKAIAGAGLIAVASLGCAGSGDAGNSGHISSSPLFVRDVLAQPDSSDGGCVYSSTPTQPSIASGTLDIAVVQQYSATYLVGTTQPSITSVGVKSVRITDAAGMPLSAY